MKEEQTILHQPESGGERREGNPLDEFRGEIEARKMKEAGTRSTDDFTIDVTNGRAFNPLQLNEADMKMWRRMEQPGLGIVSRTDFEKYRAQIMNSGNPTRNRFAQFLANKLSVLWGREELKQLRASRDQLKKSREGAI